MEVKTYHKEKDGSLTLVSTETIQEPTNEEVIAEKEAELLKMYNELQALKESNS